MEPSRWPSHFHRHHSGEAVPHTNKGTTNGRRRHVRSRARPDRPRTSTKQRSIIVTFWASRSPWSGAIHPPTPSYVGASPSSSTTGIRTSPIRPAGPTYSCHRISMGSTRNTKRVARTSWVKSRNSRGGSVNSISRSKRVSDSVLRRCVGSAWSLLYSSRATV